MGLVRYAAAQRLRVPPDLVVSAVVPMLPESRSMRPDLLGEGSRRDTAEGLVALITAASVALALAAGVILGECLAQPLARGARRVEERLSGPRLVGPLRMPRRTSRQRQPGRDARTRSQRSGVSTSKGARPATTSASTKAHDSSASETTSGG